jgi:hypothetical protein
MSLSIDATDSGRFQADRPGPDDELAILLQKLFSAFTFANYTERYADFFLKRKYNEFTASKPL